MRASTISAERKAEILKKYGIKTAPADHPIYSEGPTIAFIRHTSKPSEREKPVKKKGGRL